ncbi:hypothetical protein BY458DRAFT_533715 [Sporodiniella umbellata]|nr:hypothetical protein BY458DRAFT_533715 [Sporodiniella umbellata]
MSSIYTLFDATLSEMNVDIEGYAPNYSAVFLVKQHFANNSLKKYLEKRRKNGFDIEPIHAVQMGVNIFSMLADAHQISTYLIDITTKSLYVDTDGRLCFTSFRSALNSQQRRQPKPWLNTDHLIFPEKSDNGLDTYSEATDVFLACAVIMNIITDNNKRNFKAFKIDHSKERVTVSEDVIDKRNRILLEAIRPGLAYAPENRSPALKILKSLESILNQSTFTLSASDLENAPTQKKKGGVVDKRDFDDLLGALFDESMNPKGFSPTQTLPPPKIRSSETFIEQKLLKLIDSNSYKSKPAVPHAMSNAFHRATEEEEKEVGDSNILDAVETFDYSWLREKMSQDERIKMKEKEMRIRESVLGAKTILEAIGVMSKEIDRNEYPVYYPNVVKTVLDYASKIDPYLTLSIFEQVKTKSIQSYISGCTVETYNTILLLRWEAWRDVHGMLDLLEEMSVNGVQVDATTRSIVGKVVNEIEDNGDDYVDNQTSYWDQDERRSCNIMKEMANKWLIKN